jgi:hypothetical protein
MSQEASLLDLWAGVEVWESDWEAVSSCESLVLRVAEVVSFQNTGMSRLLQMRSQR